MDDLGYLRPDQFLDGDNDHKYHDYHYQGIKVIM